MLCILQLNAKKQFAVGLSEQSNLWIVILTNEITFTTVTTDVVNGACIAFGVYQSYAMKQSIGFLMILVSYLLPMALLAFCYARIIRALRSKVILLS